MKIFIATKNQKKLVELTRILIPLGFEVLSEKDLDSPLEEIEETGTTFKENAILKAKAGLKKTGYISVADDSGICVDYLSGAPGIFSARYSGGNDTDNNNKLLKELEGIPMKKRQAHYTAAIACVFPDGREFTVEGQCHGHIALEPQEGNGGFGYDPLFISENGPFSQLTAEQKDTISHRGKALRLFKEEIEKYL
ncbi:MAG: RdgB/HAM1 family non-canonical purine NTP pyrophosphatase [Clostridia bacterium]|nr:RdgB/HAM1 family non-canonical purine NTP pyrophosphatase [Clostridia bacterium]